MTGPHDPPALLYLHGGPGGMGCLDFMVTQAPALSDKVRVVAFDDRGTLRSEGYSEHKAVRLTDIVADAEALRTELGIGRWGVLGHS